MQAFPHPGEQTYVRLGSRRGQFDSARFGGDQTWGNTETECPLGTRAYPSPPMSGSPTLPSKPVLEAGDRGQSSFQATSHDVYRRTSTVQGGDRRAALQTMPAVVHHQSPVPGPTGIRPYPLETAERIGYSSARPDESHSRPLTLPALPMSHHPQYPLPPVPGPMPTTSPYSMPPRPQTSEGAAPYTSPKSQRKTKGHVASACVPCKRAHLR